MGYVMRCIDFLLWNQLVRWVSAYAVPVSPSKPWVIGSYWDKIRQCFHILTSLSLVTLVDIYFVYVCGCAGACAHVRAHTHIKELANLPVY